MKIFSRDVGSYAVDQTNVTLKSLETHVTREVGIVVEMIFKTKVLSPSWKDNRIEESRVVVVGDSR